MSAIFYAPVSTSFLTLHFRFFFWVVILYVLIVENEGEFLTITAPMF